MRVPSRRGSHGTTRWGYFPLCTGGSAFSTYNSPLLTTHYSPPKLHHSPRIPRHPPLTPHPSPLTPRLAEDDLFLKQYRLELLRLDETRSASYRYVGSKGHASYVCARGKPGATRPSPSELRPTGLIKNLQFSIDPRRLGPSAPAESGKANTTTRGEAVGAEASAPAGESRGGKSAAGKEDVGVSPRAGVGQEAGHKADLAAVMPKDIEQQVDEYLQARQ